MSITGKSVEAGGKLVVARASGEGAMGRPLISSESLWGGENVLTLTGKGFTTLCTH